MAEGSGFELSPEAQATLAGLTQAAQGGAQIAGGIAAYRHARANARALRRLGRRRSADERRAGRMAIAAQLNAMAANGIQAGSGTALDIRTFSAEEVSVQELRTRNRFERLADVQRARGRSQRAAGIVSGANTILGGAARALDAGGG